jgi:hypothetical protein
VFDALNKGVRAASGEVFTCLGADDAVAPGALRAVAEWFHHRHSDWMVGGCRWINGQDQLIGSMLPPPSRIPRNVFASLGWNCLPFAATFMTRDFFERLGGYDVTFKIMGDYNILAQALDVQPFDRLAQSLVILRLHGQNLSGATGSRLFGVERERIARSYGPPSRLLRHFYRQILRFWLNGREPGWFVGKRLYAPRGHQ